MGTGHKGVVAGDSSHEILFDQEIKGSINGWRVDFTTGLLGEAINQLIGTQWLPTRPH